MVVLLQCQPFLNHNNNATPERLSVLKGSQHLTSSSPVIIRNMFSRRRNSCLQMDRFQAFSIAFTYQHTYQKPVYVTLTLGSPMSVFSLVDWESMVAPFNIQYIFPRATLSDSFECQSIQQIGYVSSNQ